MISIFCDEYCVYVVLVSPEGMSMGDGVQK